AHDRHGEVHQASRYAGAVEDGADQHEHGNGQQRILGQPGIKALRDGHQPEPLRVEVGQYDGKRACNAQGNGDRYANGHENAKAAKQQRRDHLPPRNSRCSMPVRRSVMTAARMGTQIEYHHVGMPMAGEVSPQVYSSYTMRADRMVRARKSSSEHRVAMYARRR